jgi:hypothetical protein
MQLSNYPPGVTESMVPGCGPAPAVWELVPEAFVELTEDVLADIVGGVPEPDAVLCDWCGETVGPVWGVSAWNEDVDALRWGAAWVCDENIVCDDCKCDALVQAGQDQEGS